MQKSARRGQSMKSIAYVGLDVHKDTVVAALYIDEEREPIIENSFANDLKSVRKVFKRWSDQYDLRCCYEASGCGYVVQRWLADMSIHCDVIAPSLIPVRPGDRIKTDRRDAKKLAKLYRAGELTCIHIPTQEEESARSLVRCRETMSKEIKQSKHYILKFLNLRGFIYRDGENWTQKHWRYLRSLKFDGADEIVWREYLCLLEYKLNRLDDLDKEIEAVAFSDAYKDVVGRLRCFKGIDTTSAMVLATEIGDWRRFESPAQLMSYLGLVPGAHNSGSSSSRCSITKAGNSRCRRILTEAGWNYRHSPGLGEKLKTRQKGQDAEVISISWKAQHRLHKKYWKLSNRGASNKAVVAVARELVGFLWAAMIDCNEVIPVKAA